MIDFSSTDVRARGTAGDGGEPQLSGPPSLCDLFLSSRTRSKHFHRKNKRHITEVTMGKDDHSKKAKKDTRKKRLSTLLANGFSPRVFLLLLSSSDFSPISSILLNSLRNLFECRG